MSEFLQEILSMREWRDFITRITVTNMIRELTNEIKEAINRIIFALRFVIEKNPKKTINVVQTRLTICRIATLSQ